MHQTQHFFKAKSALGGVNKLIRQPHLINGVEDGPDRILTPEYLKNFPEYKLSEFIFSAPQDISPDSYYPTLAKELEEFSQLINQELASSEIQVVIGGDNSVTLSSLKAVLQRIKDPQKVGYVQFDSHGEMHLSKSSISKNFHGMYMRPFFSTFDVLDIDKLVPKKLSLSQVFTIGDIIFDEGDTGLDGERALYKNIRNVNRAEFLRDKARILQEFMSFNNQSSHLHINFDIDVFDDSIAGATGENEGVWFMEEISPFLNIINQHPSKSIDLVEYNPHLPGASKTLDIIHQVLNLLLQP